MYYSANSPSIRLLAKIGLSAKGVVYCLIGLFAIMAAFEVNGHSARTSDRTGVMQNLLSQPFGNIVLLLIAAGLLCYSIWRFLESLLDLSGKGSNATGIGQRLTYFFSGLTYLSVSFFAAKTFWRNRAEREGDSYSDLSKKLLESPGGTWLLIIAALILAGIGLYQIYYGIKEKHRKHIDLQSLNFNTASILIRAGKVGYISRGLVWLVIAFLFFKASSHRNPEEAGDTGKAFSFIQHGPLGTYMLAAIALGLICYGVTNFLRAFFQRGS
ncbi:DUF1206 domain-containing protein [Desertivirga brevis]|uniref:DUF1206 domain-containing protein n=1 Tax=Desertivirga brevis TaxID=2810310 RepID=UPI001A9676B6|nr:DUF1206 domain-containing protein [Pedobacter sp. SYSU D00873]